MWKSKLNKVSKSILSDYSHDFINLSCKQFKPNQELEYGLPITHNETVFFMIKPDSGTLGFYVFSKGSLYFHQLSSLGDVEDTNFDFAEITNKKLFLAVHKDGHFYEKIDIVSLIKEISIFASLNNSVFLLQIDNIDLDLSGLALRISDKLALIREPITVTTNSGSRTKNHKERHRDLDRYGDKIIDSLNSGVCSSVVVWCFASKSPSINFSKSNVSVSWVDVDSNVISKNVSIGNRFTRLFTKNNQSLIQDIFKSSRGEIYTHEHNSIVKFLGEEVTSSILSDDDRQSYCYDILLSRYANMIESGSIPGSRRDIEPKLGDKIILKSSEKSGFLNKTPSEYYVYNFDGSVSVIPKPDHWFIRDHICSKVTCENNIDGLLCFDILGLVGKEIRRYLNNRKNSPAFFFDDDVTLHQKNIESSKTVDSDNLTKSESFEGVCY